MYHRRGFLIILAVTCVLQVQSADKYTDENRPYEFGFKIDGEQHRHEKKDENGIIMGEFGFITADGVYHVTVYATDENGNFKILSMKNIRVKPYPTGPERQGHSLPFPPSQNLAPSQGPISQKPQFPSGPSPAIQPQAGPPQAPPPQAAPAKSCSSCSIPTTTTRKPILTDIAVVSRDQQNRQGFGGAGQQYPQGSPQNSPANRFPQSNQGQNYPQGGSGQNYPQAQNYPQQGSQGNDASRYPQQGGTAVAQAPGQTLQAPLGSFTGDRNPKQFTNYPQGLAGSGNSGSQGGFSGQVGSGGNQFGPGATNAGSGQFGPGGSNGGSGQFGPGAPNAGSGQFGPGASNAGSGQFGPEASNAGSGQFGPGATNSGPGQFGPAGSNGGNGQFGSGGAQGPTKPTLISAQMQIVDKNTDIHHRNPGEQEGLPNGISKNDMLQLLYTFNYTVGFHAHFEEGYTNGAKQGYYYVTGRNGVRTRVDYVADEKGFRPKISQEVLDLLSEDVPKPETEKDEKYGLKGYEFKWLYYPAESSS